jgi:uncharacterized protein YozE (UPF0346 family)
VLLHLSTILIWIIRKIEQKDNTAVAELIQAVFDEPNIPKVGTAYEDVYLDLCLKNIAKDSIFLLWNTMVKLLVQGCALLKMKRRPS